MFNCGIETILNFLCNRGFEKNRENQRNTTLLVLRIKKKYKHMFMLHI